MRLIKYINEKYSFNNWVKYTKESLKWDYEEYKKKEDYKWKGRMEIINGRWPIFNNLQHLKSELDKAKIINQKTLKGKEGWSSVKNISDLKNLVSGYVRPRDVNRIVKGFNSNDKIPMPIILKSKNQYWPLAGNTRQNVAKILNIPVKVLIINVDKNYE